MKLSKSHQSPACHVTWATRLRFQLAPVQLPQGPGGLEVRTGAPDGQMLGQSLLRSGSPAGGRSCRPPGGGVTGPLPRSLGSRSLWLMARRLHPDRPGKQAPRASPSPSRHRCLSSWPPGQVPLLLLARKILPVDEGESAEDEEHAAPPQRLLALSVQHKAQGGRAEDVRKRHRDRCDG